MLVFGSFMYLLFSYFFIDIQINKYADVAAIKDQKAIEHGWVPSILPLSAYEITETHDQDKNELFGSFKYKEEDEKNFLKHLSKKKDDILKWNNFLFRVDTKLNFVKFRNDPNPTN